MNGHQQGAAPGPVTLALVADTLVVRGEVDLASAPALGVFLQAHLDGSRSALALDMSGVMFFAAAGLRALLGAAETARRLGVALDPVLLSPAVTHVLDVTGTADQLDRLLRVRSRTGPDRPRAPR